MFKKSRKQNIGYKPNSILVITALMFFPLFLLQSCNNREMNEECEKIDIAKVVSDFPAGFSLLTHKDMQFVAYYDTLHRMTIASRHLIDKKWNYRILGNAVPWDAHNYITMKIDKNDMLHVSGNMHVSPLIYARTEKPLDIMSLKEINYMVGRDEIKTTYPIFMDGPDNELIFHYRNGSSGNGNEIYNVYDYASKTWRRLMDKPLTDGLGKMNAYQSGPTLGPDGYYHLIWVWRDTSDCSTNHHLSYAKSKDLVHWENIYGQNISLPITIDNKTLWVDPIPQGGGIINGAAKIGFDSKNKILITYHKHDENSNTQAYIARFADNAWQIMPISKWNYHWDFNGGGTIGKFHVLVGSAKVYKPGIIRVDFEHIKSGKGYWLIDENTLKVKEECITGVSEGYGVTSGTDVNELKMEKRSASDIGDIKDSEKKYSLEWYSFPTNRDTMRTTVRAIPSMLQLIIKKR